MKKHKHSQLFLRAFKTFRKQIGLLWIAPVASLIGLAALIDVVLYSVLLLLTETGFLTLPVVLPDAQLFANELVNGSGGMVGIVGNLLMVIGLIFLATWLQTGMVHVTYKHGKGRRVTPRHATKASAKDFGSALVLQVVSAGALIGLGALAGSILWTLGSEISAWLWVPIVVLYALLVFFVLTYKLIALQLIAGADMAFLPAIKKTAQMIRGSWFAILEYNAALLVINLIGMVLLYGLAILASFVLLVFLGAFAFLFGAFNPAGITSLVSTIALLVSSGVILLYNLAAWSQLVHKLQKGHIMARTHTWIKNLKR